MKTKFFRKNASVKAGALVRRLLRLRLAMTALLLWPMVLSAQNGVTVSNLSVGAGTVTFNVSWNIADVPPVWLDSVWVFVDYNDTGAMKRLPLAPGATLTTHTAPDIGRVIQYPDNNKGVWVVGNARTAGSFSATVQLLTATADLAGACAYASNYPPVGEYISFTHLSFTGTPVYNIVLKNAKNEMIYRTSGADYDIPGGYTLVSFTDKTGAPGIMKCIPPVIYTLNVSASSFCKNSTGVQFALSGTENGRQYQLLRNNSAVDAVLAGDGNAATFSESFNVAGAYTVRTVADDLYCASAMDGTREIIENPLPANPAVNNASRNCPGAVTLSASSSGAVIDWYADAASTMTLYTTGASYTTPEIETSTTYYVQARFENTGCLSTRVPVLAEVITEGCCQEPGSTVTFTAFIPCKSAATNSVWYLTDTREGSNSFTYKVKKLVDGRIWMAENLKFGDKCNKTTFTGTTSTDQLGKVNSSGTYYGDCRQAYSSGGGYLYDWAAAVNAPGAGTSGTYMGCSGTGAIANACQGICPDNWHLPTYQDWYALYSIKYDNDTWPSYTTFESTTGWPPITNNPCNASGGKSDGGWNWGYEWLSTAVSATRSDMIFSAAYYPRMQFSTSGGYVIEKSYGLALRCLMDL